MDFVAKTQNPSVFDPLYEEFTVSSLDDFWEGTEETCCSASSKQSRNACWGWNSVNPDCGNLFVSTIERKKWVSRNAILF